jgi:hypothetical protein
VTGEVQERPIYAEPEGEHREGISPATILFGLILLVLGSLWLLDVADIISVTWTLVGSVILILLGLALIAVARHGSHGGMIFLGIVLSFVVMLGSLASWPTFEGGVGDRAITPATMAELEEEYSWGAGSQVIDFRNLEFPPGETSVRIQMGMGDLEIHLPDDVAHQVDWSVGVGNVQVFERDQSGVGLSGTYEDDDYEATERQLSIEIQLGMGSVEVGR